MAETRRRTIRETWALLATVKDRRMAAFLRASLVTGLLSVSVMVVGPVAVVAAAILRDARPMAVVMATIALFFASGAVKEVFRIRLGRWTDLDGRPISPETQPGRFRSRTAMHGFILVAEILFVGGAVWAALDILGQ